MVRTYGNEEWELIGDVITDARSQTTSTRIKVPGGWLYRTVVINTAEGGAAVTQTLIPFYHGDELGLGRSF